MVNQVLNFSTAGHHRIRSDSFLPVSCPKFSLLLHIVIIKKGKCPAGQVRVDRAIEAFNFVDVTSACVCGMIFFFFFYFWVIEEIETVI